MMAAPVTHHHQGIIHNMSTSAAPVDLIRKNLRGNLQKLDGSRTELWPWNGLGFQ
jgi:hypothetical protein